MMTGGYVAVNTATTEVGGVRGQDEVGGTMQPVVYAKNAPHLYRLHMVAVCP